MAADLDFSKLKSDLDTEEVPELGKMYQDSGIVIHITTEIKDAGAKALTRYIITVDNGVIYTLKVWRWKTEGEIVKETTTSIGTPFEDYSEMEAASTKKNKVGKESSKKKKKKKKKSRVSTTDLKNTAPDYPDACPLTVYSEKDPERPVASKTETNSDEPAGIWAYNTEDAGEAEEDAEFWKPQEVDLYKPDEDIEPVLEDDPDLLVGVWCSEVENELKEKENDDDDDDKKDEIDDDSHTTWKPAGEIFVVPPNKDVPINHTPTGKYTMKAPSSWPPPVDVARKARSVGKLAIPKCFDNENGFVPIKVFPASKVPKEALTEPSQKSSKKTVKFAPVGVWSYPELGSKKMLKSDDDHFLPMGVNLHWGKQKKQQDHFSSDDKSLSYTGLWGSSVSSPDDSTEDPQWTPGNSLVFPPGTEPTPDVNVRGYWSSSAPDHKGLPNKLSKVWPPEPATTALVYPKRSVFPKNIEKGVHKGVWEFPRKSEDKDVDEASKGDWEPQAVILHGLEANFEESNDEDTLATPNGLFGVKKDAEPDSNWDYEPNDLVFFPPNESPPEDVVVRGKWSFPQSSVGKLGGKWPPEKSTANKQTGVRKKLKVPACFQGGKTVPIKVYPRKKLPVTDSKGEGEGSGCWSYPKGKEQEDEEFLPQDIDLYFGDDEPPTPEEISEEDNDDDNQNHDFGVWGTSKDDELEDDFNGNNVLVFPPGVSPGPDVCIRGKWAPPNRLKNKWPPSMSTRASVYTTPKLPKVAPKGKTIGRWKFPSKNSEPEDSSSWSVQDVNLHGSSEKLGIEEDTPHGSWGTKKGSDETDPKNVWFYPPKEEPEEDCTVRGKWSSPKTRAGFQSSWPPKPENARSRMSVGKLESPGVFLGNKKTVRSSQFLTGKLETPGAFLSSPKANTPRKSTVGKLKLPLAFK